MSAHRELKDYLTRRDRMIFLQRPWYTRLWLFLRGRAP